MTPRGREQESGTRSAADRTLLISDVVFGVVMTGLALQIPLPDPGTPASTLHDALADRIPEMIGFAFGFLVIAGFWVGHHSAFAHLHRRGPLVVWGNLAFLLCVAFLAFSTALAGQHLGTPLAVLFYAGSVVITALVWLAFWWLASADEPLEPGVRRRLAKPTLATIVVFLLSSPAAAVVLVIGQRKVSLAALLWLVFLPALWVSLGRREARAAGESRGTRPG